MTTHDAAVTNGTLLPEPLIDAISYTADNEPLTETVLEWLPRFRYIFHKTTQTIVIAGCQVRNIDPSRYFSKARTPWTKRVEIFDNEKGNRDLPADAGIVVIMKWFGHAQSLALKNQALGRRPGVPILIGETVKDIKHLLNLGVLLPETFQSRVKAKFPHSYQTLNATARALMQVQANQTIRRLAYGDHPPRHAADRFPEVDTEMPTTDDTQRTKAKRGAVKAFMARHPTAEELASPEWKAATTDDAKGYYLLAIAHAEGVPTTHGTIVNSIRELRRAAAAAEAAEAERQRAALPLDTPTPAPAPAPEPPPPVRVEGTLDERPSHPALTSAHSAIDQAFETLRLMREHHKAMGEQLDLMEMALQDAQRFAGSELIVDMQKGMQAALQEAMIAKFGQFLAGKGTL